MKLKFIKIKPRLIDFDGLNCDPLFNYATADYDEDCLFESCDEKGIYDKQQPGICCIDDCPFGYSASLRNMLDLDSDIYEYWKDKCTLDKDGKDGPVHQGSRWFVQEWEIDRSKK